MWWYRQNEVSTPILRLVHLLFILHLVDFVTELCFGSFILRLKKVGIFEAIVATIALGSILS